MSIRRQSAKRNEKNVDSYAYDPRKKCIVTAKEAAIECMRNGVDPLTLVFKCPGRSKITKEKCGAELTLCSAGENNCKEPYFAHRGSKKAEHIKHCDCATDYRTLQISRMLDRTLSRVDIKVLFDKMVTGMNGDEVKHEENNSTDEESKIVGAQEDETLKIKDTEVSFVPIDNILDLYLVLAMAIHNDKIQFTATGEQPQELIVNSKTIEQYKNGNLKLEGVKLVVASGKALNPNNLRDIKRVACNAFWVLEDIDEDSRKRIYYILCSDNPKARNKAIKKINPTSKKEERILILGEVERVEYVDGEIIICKINIRDFCEGFALGMRLVMSLGKEETEIDE